MAATTLALPASTVMRAIAAFAGTIALSSLMMVSFFVVITGSSEFRAKHSASAFSIAAATPSAATVTVPFQSPP